MSIRRLAVTRLARRNSMLSASLRFVMQERVETGFGDIRVSSEIDLGREKRPGVSAFPASVNQIVDRSVHSRRTNVRVRFEVVDGIEKERIANGLEGLRVRQRRCRRFCARFPEGARRGSYRITAPLPASISNTGFGPSDLRSSLRPCSANLFVRPNDLRNGLQPDSANLLIQLAHGSIKDRRGCLETRTQLVKSSQDRAICRVRDEIDHR